MNINRDVAAFKRKADGAFAAMQNADGLIASYCFADANFYIGRAIEIAAASGSVAVVDRLEFQRDRINSVYERTAWPLDAAGVERWENEGGAQHSRRPR